MYIFLYIYQGQRETYTVLVWGIALKIHIELLIIAMSAHLESSNSEFKSASLNVYE